MKKKILLSLMAVAMVSMSASAATKYEINIAGIEVTSDNCNYISSSTSGNDGITSGYAKYVASSNTLYLYDLVISRDGSSDYCIHNRKCEGLTIRFEGSCNIYSQKAPALKLQKNTRLNFYSGTSTIYSKTSNAVAVDNNARITFFGSGYANFKTTGGSADCFKGGGGSAVLDFCGVNTTIKSYGGHAVNTFDLQFYWNTSEYGQTFCNVRIYSNGTKQSINNCTFHTGSGVELLEPYQSYYSSSSKTICTSSGSPVTSQDIYISNLFVAILNSTYFPDANFRGYLQRNCFPKGYITTSDVNSTKVMNASSEYIFSLQGLEYFTKLENFACEENQLTSLPTLPSTLKILNCSDNKLTSLPYMPSGLTQLICDKNQLTSLPSFPNTLQILECENNKLSGTVNLSNHPALSRLTINDNPNMTTLKCNNCSLTTLNVENCTALTNLDCYSNQLTTLDISTLNNLVNLNCSNNKLSGSFNYCDHSSFKILDISNNPNLTYIYCFRNALNSLNVRNCSGITSLYCYSNAITSLDLTGCTALMSFNCSNNLLTSLNVKNLSNLINLYCWDNKLSSLDVSNMTELTKLNTEYNLLTTLNVQGCSYLNILICHDNKLSSLNVQGCSYLRAVNCTNNQITETGTNTLVNSLPTIPVGEQGILNFYNNQDPDEGNIITNAQVIVARRKGWLPRMYDNNSWVDIPFYGGVPGDVNGDGFVTSADVTAIYDVMLGTDNTFQSTADVNGDGYVTSADVTAVYDIMLGN